MAADVTIAMDRGMSSGNDYCDGDGDNDDDEYSDGDDNIDGFAHNDFDDDDGDGVLQKRNLDNNKAASLHVSKANGRVRECDTQYFFAKWSTTIPTDTATRYPCFK